MFWDLIMGNTTPFLKAQVSSRELHQLVMNYGTRLSTHRGIVSSSWPLVFWLGRGLGLLPPCLKEFKRGLFLIRYQWLTKCCLNGMILFLSFRGICPWTPPKGLKKRPLFIHLNLIKCLKHRSKLCINSSSKFYFKFYWFQSNCVHVRDHKSPLLLQMFIHWSKLYPFRVCVPPKQIQSPRTYPLNKFLKRIQYMKKQSHGKSS